MKTKNGNSVRVHYVGTLNNGEEFDNSYTRNETLDFKLGEGELIEKFENELIGMEVGEKKTFMVDANDAYGERREEAIIETVREKFPKTFNIEVGVPVQINSEQGPMLGRIHEVNGDDVTIDLNHPLAGETLNFEVELIEIKED